MYMDTMITIEIKAKEVLMKDRSFAISHSLVLFITANGGEIASANVAIYTARPLYIIRTAK